jgi:hypothetical protein
MARGEGATTKQLEQAIIDAASGSHVFYLTMGPTGYYEDLADYLASETPKAWDRTQRRLQLGDGAIYFRRGDDGSFDPVQTHGLKPVIVVRDHAL